MSRLDGMLRHIGEDKVLDSLGGPVSVQLMPTLRAKLRVGQLDELLHVLVQQRHDNHHTIPNPND